MEETDGINETDKINGAKSMKGTDGTNVADVMHGMYGMEGKHCVRPWAL